MYLTQIASSSNKMASAKHGNAFFMESYTLSCGGEGRRVGKRGIGGGGDE